MENERKTKVNKATNQFLMAASSIQENDSIIIDALFKTTLISLLTILGERKLVVEVLQDVTDTFAKGGEAAPHITEVIQ